MYNYFFFCICKFVGQFLYPYVLVAKLEQWKINNYETTKRTCSQGSFICGFRAQLNSAIKVT